MQGAMMARKKTEIDSASRMLREVRKAERTSGAGEPLSGTGFTILKLRQPPIARLIDKGKIGPEEMQAADEIERAFFAIDGRGRMGAMTLDRVDGGRHSDMPWPAAVSRAVRTYQAWANHWSARNKSYGDPMLEVVIAAVIDERPVREISLDIGRRHSTVEYGLTCGLRHYAAAAGFVSGHMAGRWTDAAERAFVRGNTRLLDATRRAAIEC